MNIYRYTFTAECPNDGAQIEYHLTIKTGAMLMAERIVEATKGLRGFQEHIANKLADLFPGQHTLIAVHNGVEVETQR